MSCAFPIPVSVKDRFGVRSTLSVPCGRCMSCRITRQSQLDFLCQKELYDVYKAGLGASFVTLTYDDDHLPFTVNIGSYGTTVCHGVAEAVKLVEKYSSLGVPCTMHNTISRSDFQKFMKRLRINMKRANCNIPFKYISCGEYGDRFGRSHYHIVFLGLSDVLASQFLKDAWPFGMSDIGVLKPGGLRYVLKYCTKANTDPAVKALRKAHNVEQPFLLHSIGLGKAWIYAHKDELEACPFFHTPGGLIPVPKYVVRFLKVHCGSDVTFNYLRYLLPSLKAKSLASDMSVREYLADQAFIKERQAIAAAVSSGFVVDRHNLYSRTQSWVVRQKMQKNTKRLVQEC